jgi:hypothetical protein
VGAEGAIVHDEDDGNGESIDCKQELQTSEAEVHQRRCGSFAYLPVPLPYDWPYKYRHAVDDHNNLRHSLLSVEGTIMTIRWEMRVFSFLLAVSEVNAFLTYRFFCKPDSVPTLQEFCHKLAWQLIKNRWIMEQNVSEQ